MADLEIKKILIEESLRKNQMSQIFDVVKNEKWCFSDHYNNTKTTNFY